MFTSVHARQKGKTRTSSAALDFLKEHANVLGQIWVKAVEMVVVIPNGKQEALTLTSTRKWRITLSYKSEPCKLRSQLDTLLCNHNVVKMQKVSRCMCWHACGIRVPHTSERGEHLEGFWRLGADGVDRERVLGVRTTQRVLPWVLLSISTLVSRAENTDTHTHTQSSCFAHEKRRNNYFEIWPDDSPCTCLFSVGNY